MKENTPTLLTYDAQPNTKFQLAPAYISLSVIPIIQYASFGTIFMRNALIS